MPKPDRVFYTPFKYGSGTQQKDEQFFCHINGQRWQLIENQLALAKPLKGWLTVDNRLDRQEIW